MGILVNLYCFVTLSIKPSHRLTVGEVLLELTHRSGAAVVFVVLECFDGSVP